MNFPLLQTIRIGAKNAPSKVFYNRNKGKQLAYDVDPIEVGPKKWLREAAAQQEAIANEKALNIIRKQHLGKTPDFGFPPAGEVPYGVGTDKVPYGVGTGIASAPAKKSKSRLAKAASIERGKAGKSAPAKKSKSRLAKAASIEKGKGLENQLTKDGLLKKGDKLTIEDGKLINDGGTIDISSDGRIGVKDNYFGVPNKKYYITDKEFNKLTDEQLANLSYEQQTLLSNKQILSLSQAQANKMYGVSGNDQFDIRHKVLRARQKRTKAKIEKEVRDAEEHAKWVKEPPEEVAKMEAEAAKRKELRKQHIESTESGFIDWSRPGSYGAYTRGMFWRDPKEKYQRLPSGELDLDAVSRKNLYEQGQRQRWPVLGSIGGSALLGGLLFGGDDGPSPEELEYIINDARSTAAEQREAMHLMRQYLNSRY